MTQGVLYVHSAPRALTPHIEWAASGVLSVPARIRWEDQPVGRGLQRAEMTWRGREDTGARLVSALRGMVDTLRNIDAGAPVWVMTPKAGRDGHVMPGDIQESAGIAGLRVMSSVSVARDWTGTRLASRTN